MCMILFHYAGYCISQYMYMRSFRGIPLLAIDLANIRRLPHLRWSTEAGLVRKFQADQSTWKLPMSFLAFLMSIQHEGMWMRGGTSDDAFGRDIKLNTTGRTVGLLATKSWINADCYITSESLGLESSLRIGQWTHNVQDLDLWILV